MLNYGDFTKNEGITDKIHGRFCKKGLGLPRCTENSAAESELDGDSIRGNIMCLAVKDCQLIMFMDIQYPVRLSCEW